MAAKKKGLGRGLDLLIPEGNNTKQSKTEKESKPIIKEVVKEVVKEVKVPAETFLKLSDIEPNREQPRKNFDKEALEELADSIKQYGLIQPIVVQKKDDYYEIIAGERRWRAAKMAKLKEVPVIIKEYSPQEVMEIALIENIQRRDLNPIEEALAYKAIVERKLSVRETEKLVKAILNPKQAKLPIPSTNDVVYEKLSDKLKEIMGTKVNINHKKGGKGKIEIEYYSQDELERLLELFDSIQNQ